MSNHHLNKFLLAALALGGGLLAAKADYSSEVLADGPLVYYRLNESFTSPTLDAVVNSGSLGSAGNGVYPGSVTHPVPGAISGNGAASANGNILTVPYNAGLNTASFTIEAWLKPNATHTGGTLTCPMSSFRITNPATYRTGWLIYQSATGWNLRLYNGFDANTVVNTTAGAAVAGNWYHVVATFDAGANQARLYVNGVAGSPVTPSPAFVQNSDFPFTVGSRSDGGFGWNGTADEVAFYPSVLSESDVAAHYAAATTNAAGYAAQILASLPAGYWRLDEAVPTFPAAPNSGSLGVSGNANYINGVTNTAGPSSPAYPGFGVNNSAGSFDGASGYVGTPLGVLNNRAKFTVMGWIKRGAEHSTRGGYFGQNDMLEFGDAASGASIEAWINAPGHNIVQPYPWADDEWGFIVLTADGTTETLYFNGAVAGTANSSVSSYGTNQFKFNIGGGGIFNVSGDYFLGAIDEVAAFDKVLTQGRILSLYLTATGSVDAPFMVSDPPTLTPAGTIYATTPFSLTADVAGGLPISYQWRTNGVPIPGATSATYTKLSAATGDSASYDLVATNAYGAVTSMAVVVTVDPAVPPTIDLQPVPRLVYPGGNAKFSVSASGTSPISYQWKHAGTNLPGATNATLVVPNCAAAQTGTYQVGVTNVAGGLLSSVVTLALTTPTPNSYEAVVVSLDPIAYWRLGETSGTIAYDYAGNNDGTYNSVTMGSSGAISGDANGAATFDGGSSFVNTTPVLNGLIRFSMSGWVRRGGAQANRTGLFGQNDSVEFGFIDDQTIEAWDGAIAGGIDLTNPFADSTWGFLVVVNDGTNMSIYADGRLLGTRTGRSTSVTNAFSFNLGGGGVFDTTGNYFLGDLDEVAVFDRALTVQEICALYRKGIGAVGANVPTISMISGTGVQNLANVNFSINDGGFSADTPNGQTETAWAYGTNWWSPGQATAFGNDNVSYLISPTNTATKSGVVRMTFTHRYSFEIDYDGGGVEVSVNGGPYTYVPGAQFDQNGYNGTVPGAPSMAGKRGFVGNSAGHPAFITSSCLLAGVSAGDTVNVRFVAAYDNNTTGNLTPSGWQIASVQLTEGAGAVQVACPCGDLQRKQGDLVTSPWVDLGTGATLISNTQTNQQYFRIKP